MSEPNIQERKLELIQWLALVDDDSLIDKVAKVRDDNISDWWHEISDAERESIESGVKDADSGRLRPHADARAKYEKWL